MKPVYIVIYSGQFVGHEILSVFEEREKALEYINNRINNHNIYGEYGIICTEFGKCIDMITTEWFLPKDFV